jgi:hypothetical protein
MPRPLTQADRDAVHVEFLELYNTISAQKDFLIHQKDDSKNRQEAADALLVVFGSPVTRPENDRDLTGL